MQYIVCMREWSHTIRVDEEMLEGLSVSTKLTECIKSLINTPVQLAPWKVERLCNSNQFPTAQCSQTKRHVRTLRLSQLIYNRKPLLFFENFCRISTNRNRSVLDRPGSKMIKPGFRDQNVTECSCWVENSPELIRLTQTLSLFYPYSLRDVKNKRSREFFILALKEDEITRSKVANEYTHNAVWIIPSYIRIIYLQREYACAFFVVYLCKWDKTMKSITQNEMCYVIPDILITR